MKRMMQGAVALIALVGAGESMTLEWMSNSVGFHYGQQFTNPNNPDKFAKHIYSSTHANNYHYGNNFFNLDMSLSDSRDPCKGIDHDGSEVYVVCHHQLYASRVFGWSLDTGLIKDHTFIPGFDASRNNNLVSAKKRALVFGPTLKFNGPGVLDLSLLYYREKNHFGMPDTRHPNYTFDITYMLDLTWVRPFKVGNRTTEFQGFINYVGEKGEGYNGKDTTAEVLVRTALMVAALPDDKRQPGLWFGVGYEYWHNKFGIDDGTGNQTSTPALSMKFTF